MGERVRVVRHDGGLVAVKDGRPHQAEAMTSEARVLLSVQGPGVVELIGLTDADPPALLTRWVGSRSLADVPVPLTPERAAALCLAIADILGRLHRGGLVHGAVDPSHVLLDPDGRPVLCGFGSAGPIGAPVRRPATDQGRGDDEDRPDPGATLRPALDVAGLGRVLGHLLGPTPAPRPRPGPGGASRAAATRRKALRALVDHASAEDPADRPSLAGFAHALRRAAPRARLDDDALEPSPPTDRRDRSRRPGRLPAVLAVLAVAAATYFGLSAWRAPSTTRRADASPVVPRPPAASTTTTPARSTSSSTTSPLDAPPVVEHDGRRFAVGSPGDVVVVGAWHCDDRELPVVLHPADGTVHLFDQWAAEGASLGARTVATVAGALGLHRGGWPDCPDLVVTGATGALTTLTPEDLR